MTKRCNKCGLEKPLDQFTKHPKTKDRLQVWCRSCKSRQIKEAREARRRESA